MPRRLRKTNPPQGEAALSAQLQALQKELRTLQKEIKRLQQENQQLRKENQQLREENQRLREENQRLRKENSRLTAQLEQMEQKLREANRQVAPFRRRPGRKKPEAEKKPPGRSQGHPPAFRRKPETIDEKLEVPLSCCPGCGGKVEQVRPCVQYLYEIPELRPRVYQLTTYRGECPKCGPVGTSHPLQSSTATGAAGTHLGPRAQALAVYLSHGLGLSMRRVCQAMEVLGGLKLTPGGLSQLLQRAARRVERWRDEIMEHLRSSRAVYADETSWYVGSPGWWLWVFTTPETTLYRIESSRGSDVVRKTLGDSFAGTLVSDCLASYDPIDCRKHKCIAHHLRVLAQWEEELEKEGKRSLYLTQWKVHLRDVLATKRRQGELSAEEFAEKAAQLVRGVHNLLEQVPSEGPELAFRNRMRRQREHLLGCLGDETVEPTNNRAERDLRPAVIDRKLSCGNRTVAGKRAWEILRSVVTTWSKRGLDVVGQLTGELRLAPG